MTCRQMKLFIQKILNNMLPKLVLTDIDGVWTDGGMYYGENGEEFKRFSTYDSVGVLFLRLNNIPLGIITGEDTTIVEKRARKLGIEHVYQGVRNKLQKARELTAALGIRLRDVAYIGDEINDIPLMEECGYVAIPSDAPPYMDKYADVRLKVQGGKGAFKAFIIHLLEQNELYEKTMEKYILSRR